LYDALARLGVLAIGSPDGDIRDPLVVVEELGAGPTSMAACLIGHYAVTGALSRFGSTEQHRPQPHKRPRGVRAAATVLDPRSGHEVHGKLRRRVRLDRHRGDQDPVRSPKANAVAERFVRTIRTECLDHLLVVSRGHLEAVVSEYLHHYNQARPHRSLALDQPIPRPATTTADGTIVRRDVLGGIIHEYDIAA